MLFFFRIESDIQGVYKLFIVTLLFLHLFWSSRRKIFVKTPSKSVDIFFSVEQIQRAIRFGMAYYGVYIPNEKKNALVDLRKYSLPLYIYCLLSVATFHFSLLSDLICWH